MGAYLSQRVPQVLLGIPRSSHKPAYQWQSPYLPVLPLQLRAPSSSVSLTSDTFGRSPLLPLFMVLSRGQCQGLKVPHTAFALAVITTGARPLGSGSLTPSPSKCKERTPLWTESLSTRSPGSGCPPLNLRHLNRDIEVITSTWKACWENYMRSIYMKAGTYQAFNKQQLLLLLLP